MCLVPFQWFLFISQVIRFSRVCSNVYDFNNRNIFLTAKLLIRLKIKNIVKYSLNSTTNLGADC